MDNGWITSSNGKRVDCRNIILILTSNLGAAQNEKSSIGFVAADAQHEDLAAKDFFAPEFRNRLDAVVKFERLKPVHLRYVCDKFINEINQLLKARALTVKLGDAAYALLLKEGYDEKMGARPMSRAIDRLIKLPVSKLLLEGNIPPNSVIEFDVEQGKNRLEMVVVEMMPG